MFVYKHYNREISNVMSFKAMDNRRLKNEAVLMELITL